ncbi:hypothetical protein [Rhodoferax sp.]|uniref:hypothetical protein n=1 Tax=Rhodoferax sp. TaxID=50421 RepID=UPI0025D3671E|nr:hypothetical protein [Rhodoferax sp.]
MIETAYRVLDRYFDKIADAPSLSENVTVLRTRLATNSNRPALGEPRRQAGGLTLRTGGAATKAASPMAPD